MDEAQAGRARSGDGSTPQTPLAAALERPGVASDHPSAPIPVQGPALGSFLRETLGDTGLEVFPLMLGGAEFGWTTDQERAHALLDHFVAAGGNAVHTADCYAAGRSEHIIGRWMATRRVRDDIVLAVRVGDHPDNPGLGSVNLVRAVEASLTRLGTDRIDVLYLDASAERVRSIEDTLATAEWLIEAGKVRHVGAYAFTAEHLVEARILASAGYPRLEALDVPYNLMRRREFEGDIRLVAGAQGLAVTPSHALEHGFLSGRHRSRRDITTLARGHQLAESLNRRGTRVLKALDAISAELGVPHAAIAMAWLLAQRGVVAPIVNAYSPTHIDELVQGVGVRLTRGHLSDLTKAAE
ncbi:aldo/keto reductase [Microbacterium sp. MEC084]|uniref:aldo/keto reductase n=1 Tax=Microbacterium sp. MEC084 TaxID=1963027 RepID=UPI0010700E50|nr:aldo/keto reductase [Microbacterium sp. MEC084]MCD1268268.1 aldo/keto reductase [Microbacterium sp. MEC084]